MKRTLLKLALFVPFLAFGHAAFPQKKSFLRNEFSFHTGYGEIVHNVSGLTLDTYDYRKSLSHGVNWEAHYHFHIIRQISVGLVYTGFSSWGSHAEGSDHLFIHYLAPQLSFYIQNKEHWKTRLGIGAGKVFYRDNSEVFGKPRRVTGKTPGMHASFSTAYKLTKHWGLGLEVNYIFCRLDEMKAFYHDETILVRFEESQPAKLSRINLSAGLSYYF